MGCRATSAISHRSLILNAIAQRKPTVTGLSGGDDVYSPMSSLQAMGANIEPGYQAGIVTVHCTDGEFQEPTDVLDVGNSGISMRPLSELLAN